MGMEANYSYKVQVYKNAKISQFLKETTLIKNSFGYCPNYLANLCILRRLALKVIL